MLRPMQEALDAQLQRVALPSSAIAELEEDARKRALWIAGLVKTSALEEFHALAVAKIKEGLTGSEFAEQLGEILDKQKGLVLSPQRLALINQNNLAVATASGRYKQIIDPDLLESRPLWQYPLGPHDAKTSQICAKLEGLIARHDDPIWQRIFPPNHHGERHLKVLTLAEDDPAAKDVYVSPGEKEYPVVDGQEIHPDAGFDYAPSSLLGADGDALNAAADALGEDLVEQKTAADYGRPSIAEEREPTPAPKLMPAFAENASADEVSAALDRFKEAVGWTRGEATVLADAVGDGILVNEASFARLLDAGAAAAPYFDYLVPLVEDPREVWIVQRRRGDKVVFTKRFFGVFRRRGVKAAIGGMVEVSPEGWLMDAEFCPASELDHKRVGWLAYRREVN
jgi:hypothetical protein